MQQIDDQEPGFATVRQARREATGRLVAGAPPDHLLQLDARVHRPHKDQVDHLGHVDAGLDHVDGHGDARVDLATAFPNLGCTPRSRVSFKSLNDA